MAGISTASGFSLRSRGALDDRMQFTSIAEMKDFAESSLYDGIISYNTETKKTYQFQTKNTDDETLGKWREFGGSATGGDENIIEQIDVNGVKVEPTSDKKIELTIPGASEDITTATDDTEYVGAKTANDELAKKINNDRIALSSDGSETADAANVPSVGKVDELITDAVDQTLDETSAKALANKVVKAELDKKVDVTKVTKQTDDEEYTLYSSAKTDKILEGYVQKEEGKGLFSGKYTDLTDIPTNIVVDDDIADMETKTHAGETYVAKVEGKQLSTLDVTQEILDAKIDKTSIATALGTDDAPATNDSVVGAKLFEDNIKLKVDATALETTLADYYKKTETYSQTEIDTMVGNLHHLTAMLVDVLPKKADAQTDVLYLVKTSEENIYTQYMLVKKADDSTDFISFGNTSINITALEGRVTTLEEQMADLLYKKIEITSFTNNAGTKEIGSTVADVVLTWATNKTPKTLTVNGEEITDLTQKTLTITGANLTANKTYSMSATDERNASVSETTSVSFVNGIYYGVGVPDTVDNDFVLGLTKKLQSSKATSFTVNAGAGQYIYFATPKTYGTAKFNIGGFDGGFKAGEEIEFTNASGYTETYLVYRSTNANLGNTTVKVS